MVAAPIPLVQVFRMRCLPGLVRGLGMPAFMVSFMHNRTTSPDNGYA